MTWLDALLVGLLGLASLAIAFVAFLPRLIQPLVRVILSPWYRFRYRGREHVPTSGAAVLAVNHVTWIDGLFLAASCPRTGFILANAGFFKNPALRWLARRAGIIPVPFSGPKAQRAAIVAAREALDRGELVAIFPEGQLTRNGMLGTFYRGLEVILKGRDDVPVLPVALDNLWGTRWSVGPKGKAADRRPGRRVVGVAFGPAMQGPPSLFEIRLGIQQAIVEAVELRDSPPARLESIDLALPHLKIPGLGLLAGSAEDFDRDGIVQPGRRSGTLGLVPPGVALRAVDDADRPLGEGATGRLQARVAGLVGWRETGLRGSIDRDGFVISTRTPA